MSTGTRTLGALTIWATHSDGAAQYVDLAAYFAEGDTDARDAFVAEFPKYVKMRPTTLGTWEGELGGADQRHVTLPIATSSWIKLLADGVNGGRNEAGIKRYRAAVKAAERAGIEIIWKGDCFGNAYRTQAEFEAAIA